MKLQNLIDYKLSNKDEVIFNTLTKSTDLEILEYVDNLTSDLLNSVFLINEYQANAKNNISKYNEIELGELATYICITPYVQIELSKNPNWQEKANSYLETFIGYIINTVNKDVFLENLTEMKNLIGISDKFYMGLVTYFSKNTISKNILDKLKF